MGQIHSVQAILTQAGMSDKDILAVIAPPPAARDRSKFLDASYSLHTAYGPTSKMLPGHAAWRQTSIGKALNYETQVVKSNHFPIDLKNIVGQVFQYAVHMYKYGKDGLETTDCAAEEDSRVTSTLVMTLRDRHKDWKIGAGVGMTYNGRSLVFTSRPLPLPDKDDKGQAFLAENVAMPNLDGTESKKKYRVTLTSVGNLLTPEPTAAAWSRVNDLALITALDSPILSFARWGEVQDEPEWFVVGSKAFRASGRSVQLSPSYIAMRGYYAGLKVCLAGLCLVSDMSVSCFLAGGDMIEVMSQAGGYRNVEEFLAECSGRGGLQPRRLAQMQTSLKNSKVKLIHLGHSKKMKSFGPPANHPDSAFMLKDPSGKEKKCTVADYFATMAKTTYAKFLPQGKLKYPFCPTVNIGSATKPILVPAELVKVPGGQSRSQVCTGEMTSKMIREAAVRPDERMRCITEGDTNTGGKAIVNVVRDDPTMRDFGMNNIAKEPLSVHAVILPPAKLRYGGGKTLDPMLNGTWNNEGYVYAKSPPGAVKYGLLICGGREAPREDQMEMIRSFQMELERDAKRVGLTLQMGGPVQSCPSTREQIFKMLSPISKLARIVVVVMMDACYGSVKLEADRLGLVTQCCKIEKISKIPRGYAFNIMLKVNTKLGGVNHTLESRQPGSNPGVYQDPPASLSWVFDRPCMLMGIDVSHGESFSSTESVAAVVASMDGCAGQYAAHISVQTARQEMVGGLEDAMVSLLTTFKDKNRALPSSIIVFRDGVSDGQYDQVTDVELKAIKGGIELMGCHADSIKVSIVVCTKNHHTRFFFEEKGAQGQPSSYVNPCPGLCVDASGGAKSIASANLNDFYLNSHVAIQGTAKPCKYTLVHDEIGFKMAELELLTYWLTYTYCRANKSVSYAAPAYYAHWASKRGKYLTAAGGTAADLKAISAVFGAAGKNNTMFWI